MPEPCSWRPVLGTTALSCIEQNIRRKYPKKKKGIKEKMYDKNEIIIEYRVGVFGVGIRN